MANITQLEKTLPTAPLKIVALDSCKELGKKVNDYIVSFRQTATEEFPNLASIANYNCDNYLIEASCPRFGSGEAKGILKDSIRGTDLFIMVDVCNHSLTYTVNGHTNHMCCNRQSSPYQRVYAFLIRKPSAQTYKERISGLCISLRRINGNGRIQYFNF